MRYGAAQSERDQLTRIIAAADRNDDVLSAVEHVGHRRPALRRWKVDRADLVPGRLVVGTQHRSPPERGRRVAALAGDEQRFRRKRPDDSALAGTRQDEAFERGVISDDVRRLTVRDLPADVALVEIDRRDASV